MPHGPTYMTQQDIIWPLLGPLYNKITGKPHALARRLYSGPECPSGGTVNWKRRRGGPHLDFSHE